MNNFKVILFPLALYFWIMTMFMFVNYQKDTYRRLQKMKLDLTVNYSVDAAIDELVYATADLGLDYAEYERVSAEPSIALDMFVSAFLKNYGMSESETNRSIVKSRYLPTFCVAAYDGYYIAEPTKFNASGAHDSIFSMKCPYLLEKDGIRYAVNMSLENALAYDGSHMYTEYNLPFSENEALKAINTKVNNAFMSAVYKQQGGRVKGFFYVPWSLTSIVRTQPITGTTVMAYVANIDIGFNDSIDAFAVGGAKAKREQFVACYTMGGQKLYMYTDRVPSGVTVEAILKNPEEAAKKGYRFDLSNINKP